MGKRRNSDEEEHIARKIRKLERKMAKVRRKRHRSSSSRSLSSDNYPEDARELEVRSTEEPHSGQLDTMIDLEQPDVEVTEPGAPQPGAPEPEPELDPGILSLLGDEPAKEVDFGPNIHKDIASRWSDILINGLKEDTRKELLKVYKVPENLKLAVAPALNPEIKAAVNENVAKRDSILAEKQNHMACIISIISDLVSAMLSSEPKDPNQVLKLMSDAGRFLCHLHFTESTTRRNFLLASLNKDIKDHIKELKRDQLLFGSDLSEKLKAMKAISKTGAEMKISTNKTKTPNKAKQAEASTSRALNWRGPPPPAQRRTYKQTSTAGGRKQQTTRRTTDKKTPRTYNRSGRR